MLLALRVSNLAVIEEVEIAFGQGLTVFTGETGAGRSILVDALSLLLGRRPAPCVIRPGPGRLAFCRSAQSREGGFEQGGRGPARAGDVGRELRGPGDRVRRDGL